MWRRRTPRSQRNKNKLKGTEIDKRPNVKPTTPHQEEGFMSHFFVENLFAGLPKLELRFSFWYSL
jgi:hypothetical protein